MKEKTKLFEKVGTEITSRTADEIEAASKLRDVLLKNLEKMGNKWDVHLPLFLSAPSLARILWLDFIYQKAIKVPGSLIEFGSQWGASLNIFLMLKLIHEPWNSGRRILSFSFFEEGFKKPNQKDGGHSSKGDYGVAPKWEMQLDNILQKHSSKSPIPKEVNFKIFRGDAGTEFPAYLKAHPETIISHAHFDLDLYQPTKKLIKNCIERMPKGAVLVFDEINCPSFPGETTALQEAIGIKNLSLRKTPFQPYSAYAVVGE